MNLTQRSVSAGSPIYARTMNGVLHEVRRLGALASFKGKGGMIMRSRKAGVGGASSYRPPFEVSAVYASRTEETCSGGPVVSTVPAFIVNGGVWFGNATNPFYGRDVVLPDESGSAHSDTFIVPESIAPLTEADIRTRGEDVSVGEEEIYELLCTIYLEPEWIAQSTSCHYFQNGYFSRINVCYVFSDLNGLRESIKHEFKSVFAIIGQFRFRFNLTSKSASIVEGEQTIRILQSDYFFNQRRSCLFIPASEPFQWYRIDDTKWALNGGFVRIKTASFDYENGKVLHGFSFSADACGGTIPRIVAGGAYASGYLKPYADVKTVPGASSCFGSEFAEFPPLASLIENLYPFHPQISEHNGGYFDFSNLPLDKDIVLYLRVSAWESGFANVDNGLFYLENSAGVGDSYCSWNWKPQSISLRVDSRVANGQWLRSSCFGCAPYVVQTMELEGGAGFDQPTTCQTNYGGWVEFVPIAVVRREWVSVGRTSARFVVDVYPIKKGLIEVSPSLNLRLLYGKQRYSGTEISEGRFTGNCKGVFSCVSAGIAGATCYCKISEGILLCNYSEWQGTEATEATASVLTGEFEEMQDASNVE